MIDSKTQVLEDLDRLVDGNNHESLRYQVRSLVINGSDVDSSAAYVALFKDPAVQELYQVGIEACEAGCAWEDSGRPDGFNLDLVLIAEGSLLRFLDDARNLGAEQAYLQVPDAGFLKANIDGTIRLFAPIIVGRSRYDIEDFRVAVETEMAYDQRDQDFLKPKEAVLGLSEMGFE